MMDWLIFLWGMSIVAASGIAFPVAIVLAWKGLHRLHRWADRKRQQQQKHP